MHERLIQQDRQFPRPRLGNGEAIRKGESAPKDGEAGEELLFGGGQLAPRLLEDDAHTAVAFGHIPQIAGQKIEIAADFGRDLGGIHQPQPVSGQLNGQRNALHQTADAPHGRFIVRPHRKTGLHPLPHLLEQPHRPMHLGLGRLPLGGER